ncbi:hypothetical protein [Actinomadura roseirufa]|uniref:hypothetical protein n=1 Tax=Actinomadura roseirufa TaxID=2094049 RepID=UPI00104126DC|nr:hypothetical protein [Actinomadura roseirufa]
MYTWHFTFDGQRDLHRLVLAYQGRLANVAGLDPIPLEWLHLTTQGLAFADEISGVLLHLGDEGGRSTGRVTVAHTLDTRGAHSPQ